MEAGVPPPQGSKGLRAAVIAIFVAAALCAAVVLRGRQTETGAEQAKGFLAESRSLSQSMCFPGGDRLTLKLANGTEVEVPALPDSQDSPGFYSYATAKALVSIPDACAHEYASKIKKSTKIPTKKPGQEMTYFWIADLEGTWDTLADMKSCACGLVIEAHGSGGPGWSAVQFAAIFASMGFVQVIPNSMAMPEVAHLKGRTPAKDIADIDVTNYCGEFLAMEGTCKEFNKPYCYTTKVENVVHDPENYRKYVEGVFQIRKRELDYFFDRHSDLLDAFKTVLLVGNSEGGMVASRYNHHNLDKQIKGRIISAWSCEFNYYVSCPEHAQICEDKCDKQVPVLNLIGSLDEYFGRENSVAREVADHSNGYGSPLTGNCQKQLKSQKFIKTTVVEFEDAWHGPQYYNDNAWRSVIADWLRFKGVAHKAYKSLEKCSKRDDGVYSCPKLGATSCKTIDGKYTVNPEDPYNVDAEYSC